jgi:DNA-binding NarL/FixJ family response regulator
MLDMQALDATTRISPVAATHSSSREWQADQIGLLIVSADDLFRQATRSVVEDLGGMRTVSEADDAVKALDLVQQLLPGLILLDIDALGSEISKMVVRIGELSPESKIVLVSTPGQQAQAVDALRWGAQGHLVKGACTPTEFIDALYTISMGMSILSPGVAGAILAEISQAHKPKYSSGLGLERMSGR